MAKRAANDTISVRRRTDGRYEARYWVENPTTGQRTRKSVYGETVSKAFETAENSRAEIRQGSYIEPNKITVSEWLDIWLKEYTGNIKERTSKLYEGQINYRIKPALGSVKLQSLKPPQIQSFYNGMLVGDDKISPKSIKNIHGILHKALKKAEEIGYIKKNPTAVCTLPKSSRPEIKPLDEGHVAEFLKAIQGHPYETIFVFTLFTGVRQGEALGLTWDCVDFASGTITLYRQLQRINGEYKFTTLKHDKKRSIAPAPYVMEMLKRHKRAQIERRLEAGPMWVDKNLVFTNEIGNNIGRETIYKSFKKVVRGMGENYRFHDLRHSYAVISLSRGDNIKTISENLGHHSAAFTIDTYAHVTDKMKKESASIMDAFINEVKPV